MRIQIVDPPAYTPPYDRSLSAALARAGAEVELVTSPFAHGEVPPAEGYEVSEVFYRRSSADGLPPALRRAGRAAEHVFDMVRFRRAADAAVTHYQWLTLPAVDSLLLPARRPRLLTPHGWLRQEGWGERPGRGLRRLLDSMDAIVALSEYGAARLIDSAGVAPERVRVIPHGAFDYLTKLPDPAPLAPELAGAEGPVVLAFGLIRPYKGTDLLIDAMREVPDAELWVVGRPLGVDLDALRSRAASAIPGRVRFVPRFVADRELPAIFERADVVALPYRDAEQSGVLYTALAFGKPIVLSDAGGFPEVAAHGAAVLVSAGRVQPLAEALGELLGDPSARERLAAAARAAAAGEYSFDYVAGRHLALYRELLEA